MKLTYCCASLLSMVGEVDDTGVDVGAGVVVPEVGAVVPEVGAVVVGAGVVTSEVELVEGEAVVDIGAVVELDWV